MPKTKKPDVDELLKPEETAVETTAATEVETKAEIPNKEETKKKFPHLNEEQISLLLEVETPEQEAAAAEVEVPPVVQAETLTPEQKAKLELLDSILADPDKAVYFNSIKDNTILETLSKFIPKGEDYSKLKPRDLVEKSLIHDGASKEEIEKELEEFDSLTFYKRKQRAAEALETLNSKSPAISSELTKELKKQEDIKRQYKDVFDQRVSNADRIVQSEINSLIGKTIDGITVTKENSKDLLENIISLTPQVSSPQGGVDFDVRTGIERGKKLFAYDKVLPAKDKKIKELQDLVRALTTREEQRVRPALNYIDRPITHRDAASRTPKESTWIPIK